MDGLPADLSLTMRRRLPTIPAADLDALLTLADQAIEARCAMLGPRPAGWRTLADAFALGLDVAAEARSALLEIHTLLFASPGRAVETHKVWREALLTAATARFLAAAKRGSPATAALAAIVGCAADACVLRAIDAVESRRGPRLDQATVTALVALLAPVAAAAIVRQWKLPAAIAAAVRQVRGVPEQRSPSLEAQAVYFARLIVATRAGSGFPAPGLEHEIRQALGIGRRELAGVRAVVATAERGARALERELPAAARLGAAG